MSRVKRRLLVAGVAAITLGLLALNHFVLSRLPPAPPSSPVQGLIAEVSGDSRGTNLITIEASNGEKYAVHVNPPFDPQDPDSDHLRALEPAVRRLETYQERNQPIVIQWEMRDGKPVAISIEDAEREA